MEDGERSGLARATSWQRQIAGFDLGQRGTGRWWLNFSVGGLRELDMLMKSAPQYFRIPSLLVAAACAGLAMFSSHARAADVQADVIFLNGQFETLNGRQPKAAAVAVKDEKFIAVGTNEEIRLTAGANTKVIDLGNKFVAPGFVDAHTHPMETIWIKDEWVDARFPGTKSVKEALEKIAERVKNTPAGQWVYVACVSASENKFIEKRLPTKAELDQIAPNHPVVVANGAHMAIANSKALASMGVTKGVTRLPHGAGVLLDKDGNPNGTITDGMGDIPGSPTPTQIRQYYESGIAGFWNQYGFTSVMAITPAAALPIMQETSRSLNKANIRLSASVWAAPDGEGLPDNLDRFEMPREANPDYFRFVAIKAWVDGENDCRTGYMYEPYLGKLETDPPGALAHWSRPRPRRISMRAAPARTIRFPCCIAQAMRPWISASRHTNNWSKIARLKPSSGSNTLGCFRSTMSNCVAPRHSRHRVYRSRCNRSGCWSWSTRTSRTWACSAPGQASNSGR